MNLAELQADLRHFASERDWQPFHTPKNLSTALMVEAAELAEIFQWMTPEDSLGDHVDQRTKARIGEEVADVLLYLLQLADHSQIDIALAVKEKLARNALKYPAKQAIARVSPTPAVQPATHVLNDYENVQPTEGDLRAMVPGASRLWVFHGPHQRLVEERFASFGGDVTAVPIGKTGKNALDFHLSFYLGYIASRNQASAIVVVANDKGYEPMLEHAKAMGFAVSQQGHGQARSGMPAPAASTGKVDAVAKPVAKKATAKKAAVKQVPVKKAPVNKVVVTPAAKKAAPAKKALAKSGDKPAMKSDTVARSAGGSLPLVPPAFARPVSPSTVSAESLKKLADNLWTMGENLRWTN
jgi:NTP pyrophosphatase (non-canonical NTP hydrolase)